MDESTVYKDGNSCEPGAIPPGTASASSLAGPDRTQGTDSPFVLPHDYSETLISLQQHLRAVAEAMRNRKLFDARDDSDKVEAHAKILRLVVADHLRQEISPPPRRAGVFVTDSEVG